jgi:hypothetical protein
MWSWSASSVGVERAGPEDVTLRVTELVQTIQICAGNLTFGLR